MKSNEWYTPSKYIEAAREVMGGIDLDPASCEFANKTVKAAHYYTKEDNGLMQPWYGRVWLNPPYGRTNGARGGLRSLQRFYTEKLLREWHDRKIDQAILLLLGNSCFARYFRSLWDFPLCFHEGVITFQRENGETDDFGFGTIFVYLGPNEQKFTEVFSKFGRIAKAIDIPSPCPTNLELWSA